MQYSGFAILAMAANIGAQDVAIRLYDRAYAVTLSVMVGTAIGLLVKYLLDKRYIFRYQVRGLSHDTQTFLLYSLMGVITTLVFWSFEFAFHYLFEIKAMRYLGGIIGLAIGYMAKYQLDKRFVFVEREA